MPRREHVEVLLHKAAQDLETLDLLMQHETAASEAIGFHAQQAAEKLLKAAIKATGADYPYTHAIGHLLAILQRVGADVPGPLQEVERLTPFAAHLRYEALGEGDVVDFDWVTVRQLIQDLREWVGALLETVNWGE